MNLRDINDKIGDALNVTLYYRGGFFDVRVLDVIMALGGVACMLWAYFTQGWLAALQGGALYLFIALCVLWFFPSDKKL